MHSRSRRANSRAGAERSSEKSFGRSSSFGTRQCPRFSTRPERSQQDTSANERDAQRVIGMEALTQEQDRQRAAEQWNQVHRLSGQRRPNQFHTAVEAQIRNE